MHSCNAVVAVDLPPNNIKNNRPSKIKQIMRNRYTGCEPVENIRGLKYIQRQRYL